MNSAVPEGYRHDPHSPELFVLRCPDCGHEERQQRRSGRKDRRCVTCSRLMGVTPVSEVPAEAPGEGEQRVMTDGGQSPEERQTDALEALADQTRVQNAVLLELTHELTALRRLQAGELPHEFSSDRKAGSVENRALELAERVDLDAVAMWTNEEPLADGGREIVGPNEDPKTPEHECANCGATYHGRGAALECCSDQLRTDGGHLKSVDGEDAEEEGHGPEDPTDLREHSNPAFLQRNGFGNYLVADYCVLDSGWVRVTEWDGERVKFPPHEVQAVREVSVERYGERGQYGLSRRLANEEHIEEAREKGAKEADE